MLEPGQRAPDFSLPDQDGHPVSLADLAGGTVVVYFYPKADTPGCTTQACSIRDRGSEYRAAGARVLGVSPDPVEAVKRFHATQSLDFTLLADEDRAVSQAFGAEKRSTFILDAGGTVVHVIAKASPKTHDDQVLEVLGEMATA